MGSMWTDGQSGLTSDTSSHSFPNANSSLLRALESEQEAHEVTKSQLEHEATHRREAEAETQRLAEHNKSLLNSIKLLQSTVKHMVQQQESRNTDERNTEEVTKDIKGLKEQAERKQVANSILYDVLANYKVPHTTVSNGEESTSIINLDLLNTPDPSDFSEKAELQRTLRRQIGLSSESGVEEKQSLNAEYHEKMQTTVNAEKTANTESAQDTANGLDQPSHESNSNSVPTITQASLDLKQNPTTIRDLFPDLPSTFLAKYGKHSARAANKHDEADSVTTPKKATLTATLPIRLRESSKENKPPYTIEGVPDSIALNWRVDGRHAGELRGSRPQTKANNYFTEHPIRFGKILRPARGPY